MPPNIPAGTDHPAPGTPSLAETLIARACHDLGGLVGTLMGTLELAEEEPGETEALAVSVDAARALAGRLRLMRAAWGGRGGERTGAELAELLSHAAGHPRTRTDWSAAGPGIAPALARVLLNAALVATESLPRGGTVWISGDGDEVRVTLDGRGAAWPAAWVAAVGSGEPMAAGDSRSLQPVLALRFARADGIRLSWDRTGEPPALILRCPPSDERTDGQGAI